MLSDFEMISFDAGGTLLTPYPSVGEIYSRTAAKYGCHAEPGLIEARFRELWHRRDIMTKMAAHSSEKIEKAWWRELVQEVFESFGGIREFDSFFEELFEMFAGPDCWRLFPETVEVLQAVAQRGKRMCVISNWDSRLQRLCEGMEIRPFFEFLLISAVFGASKPSSRIFEEAVRLSGVKPEKMIHIGDSIEDDIRGAEQAGIRPVLIDRSGRTAGEHKALNGTTVIRNLRQLLD